MSGYSSGRWSCHTIKTLVEEFRAAHLHTIVHSLQSGFYGWFKWTWGGKDDEQMNYHITGSESPIAVRMDSTTDDPTLPDIENCEPIPIIRPNPSIPYIIPQQGMRFRCESSRVTRSNILKPPLTTLVRVYRQLMINTHDKLKTLGLSIDQWLGRKR